MVGSMQQRTPAVYTTDTPVHYSPGVIARVCASQPEPVSTIIDFCLES